MDAIEGRVTTDRDSLLYNLRFWYIPNMAQSHSLQIIAGPPDCASFIQACQRCEPEEQLPIKLPAWPACHGCTLSEAETDVRRWSSAADDVDTAPKHRVLERPQQPGEHRQSRPSGASPALPCVAIGPQDGALTTAMSAAPLAPIA